MDGYINYNTGWAAGTGVMSRWYYWPLTQSVTPAPMASGWKCTDCGEVLSPQVLRHRCGQDPQPGPLAGPDVVYKNDTATQTSGDENT